MAANGISTLASKEDRKMAKIALAEAKRQQIGTIGYRPLNHYVGTVSPAHHRPWDYYPPIPSGLMFVNEQDEEMEFITEDDIEFVTE